MWYPSPKTETTWLRWWQKRVKHVEFLRHHSNLRVRPVASHKSAREIQQSHESGVFIREKHAAGSLWRKRVRRTCVRPASGRLVGKLCVGDSFSSALRSFHSFIISTKQHSRRSFACSRDYRGKKGPPIWRDVGRRVGNIARKMEIWDRGAGAIGGLDSKGWQWR